MPSSACAFHTSISLMTKLIMRYSHQEGTNMTITEHTPKAPRSVGLFAALRASCHFCWSSAPAAFVVALGVLALGAPSALASNGYAFSKSIGEKGSGAGQMELAYQGQLEEQLGSLARPLPSESGVAVNDETHDVYVADTDNHRVDEFEADGAFMRARGWGVADGLAEYGPCGPDSLASPPCRQGLYGTNPGEFGSPSYIAVDNSSGPSHGDVYVGLGVGSGVGNEDQGVQIEATGGPFTLTFEGETTEPIAYLPGEQEHEQTIVQGALEKLPKIG